MVLASYGAPDSAAPRQNDRPQAPRRGLPSSDTLGEVIEVQNLRPHKPLGEAQQKVRTPCSRDRLVRRPQPARGGKTGRGSAPHLTSVSLLTSEQGHALETSPKLQIISQRLQPALVAGEESAQRHAQFRHRPPRAPMGEPSLTGLAKQVTWTCRQQAGVSPRMALPTTRRPLSQRTLPCPMLAGLAETPSRTGIGLVELGPRAGLTPSVRTTVQTYAGPFVCPAQALSTQH